MRAQSEPAAEIAAVRIRNYSPADLGTVMSICRNSPEAAQWTENGFVEADLSGQVILVAEFAARICGFLAARVTAGEAELLNMAIEPAFRRKGAGSKLLAAAETIAASQKGERMYLEVRESNQGAISFYEGHGFREAGKRVAYYRDPTDNAVLMEKKLTA